MPPPPIYCGPLAAPVGQDGDRASRSFSRGGGGGAVVLLPSPLGVQILTLAAAVLSPLRARLFAPISGSLFIRKGQLLHSGFGTD